MNTIKKLIIIIAILIIIIVIAILAINYRNKNKGIDDYGNNDESNIVINYELEDVTSESKFYTISNCIQKYIDNVVQKNKKEIYNMLSKDYIKDRSINKNNIMDYINEIDKQSSFKANEMKVFGGDEIEVYSVFGKIHEFEDYRKI